MSEKHSNISIFVPHVGCPNKCSFCNQRYITGKCMPPKKSDVINAVNVAITGKNYNPETTEIAFFGGSFTAINRKYMEGLLKTANAFVKKGIVKGVRISTRPDAIDDEILELLKFYGVTSIELGAQSMNDQVLKMNNRGHTAQDVVIASKLIKEHGFELGLQIMTGLFGDYDESAIETAQKIIELKPDTVRIYPTIVLKDTDLEALYKDGIYKPQKLEDAVALASKLYEMFWLANIRVIRLGLHSLEENAYIAGPWHAAFSELCQSQIMLNVVLGRLLDRGSYIIYVSPSSISKMVGQARKNILYLKSLGFDCKVKADKSLKDWEFKIERCEVKCC